jgi:hypothetical protein
MGAIETSLAALQTGSALATHVPFISPIAGLILQALKMRGVRLRLFFLHVSGILTAFDKLGSKAVQRRMGCCDGEARKHREHRYRCRRGVPDSWPCRGRPPGWSTCDIEVPSQVCPSYAT